MNSLLQRAFRAAHSGAVSEFTDPLQKVWWPTVRDGTTYVFFSAMRGSLRAKQQDLSGILTMAADGITLNALKSDFPILPVLDELFLIGPASFADRALPDPAACKTYRLTACTSDDIAAHYHLTGELHV